MTNGTKKTTAALAGAVVLASAGYAIGSQSSDGTAGAASSAPAGPFAQAGHGDRRAGPPGARLDDLASRLGVSEDKLRDALEAVRDDLAPGEQDRTGHLEAFAKALGKTTEEVEAAFDKLHDQHRDAFAAAVAKELGVSADKVAAALEKVRPTGPDERRRGGPRADLAAVAKELGVRRARLARALRAARPERPDREDHEAELAKALGVSEEQLEEAHEALRDAHEAEHEQRRETFAAALAKELGISAETVEEELGDGPIFFGGPGGPGFRHRHHR